MRCLSQNASWNSCSQFHSVVLQRRSSLSWHVGTHGVGSRRCEAHLSHSLRIWPVIHQNTAHGCGVAQPLITGAARLHAATSLAQQAWNRRGDLKSQDETAALRLILLLDSFTFCNASCPKIHASTFSSGSVKLYMNKWMLLTASCLALPFPGPLGFCWSG